MVINTVFSQELFLKNIWSVQFFLPQDELRTNSDFNLIKLEDLVFERRETITLTSKDKNLNYIGLENIEAKTGRLTSFTVKHGDEIKSTCKRFYKGDILYGRLRPNLNKVYYNDVFDEGVCTNEIIVMSPILSKLNPVYFSEILRTEEINQRIVGLIKGAALPRVAMTELRHVLLPIPSMKKQNEISKEILKRRKDLEEYIRLVREIPLEIDRYMTAMYK